MELGGAYLANCSPKTEWTMKNLRTQIRVTMALGVLCLFMGIISHLALTDIYHGETNVSQEWNVLRLNALVFFAFISLTLFTLRRAIKELIER